MGQIVQLPVPIATKLEAFWFWLSVCRFVPFALKLRAARELGKLHGKRNYPQERRNRG